MKDVKKTDNDYRIKAEKGEEASPLIMDLIQVEGTPRCEDIPDQRPTLDEAYLELTGRTLREEETNKWSMREPAADDADQASPRGGRV